MQLSDAEEERGRRKEAGGTGCIQNENPHFGERWEQKNSGVNAFSGPDEFAEMTPRIDLSMDSKMCVIPLGK